MPKRISSWVFHAHAVSARRILLRMDPAHHQEADAAYFAAFDRQRARVLQFRLRWVCILGIFLVSIPVLGIAGEMAISKEGHASAEDIVRLWADSAMLVAFSIALVFLVRVRESRRRLIPLLMTLTIAVLVISMPFEAIAEWVKPTWTDPAHRASGADDASFRAANAFGMLFGLACILVPMRLRESLPVAGVGLATFAAVLWFMLRTPGWQPVWGSVLIAVYAMLGVAWSRWRYGEFDAHFRTDRLLAKYASLSQETRQVSAELTQARRLHESLFPPMRRGGDIALTYQYEPMREVGGDFLYVHDEPNGAITFVLIDVTGHGVPAALSVNRLYGELQRFFMLHPEPSSATGLPGNVLAELNTYTHAWLSPQGVFATAIAVRCDPRAGRIEWANAGHPPGIVVRSSGEPIELPASSPMLGVIEGDEFGSVSRVLEFVAGDRLVAYTDGAMEARDARGQDFTSERILSIASDAGERGVPSGEIPRVLLDAVFRHRHGQSTDDTLIVELSIGKTESKSRAMSRPSTLNKPRQAAESSERHRRQT